MNFSVSFRQALLAGLLVPGVGCGIEGAMAEQAKARGIVTTASSSAVLSTADMPRGSEMWAIWISLPPGRRAEVKEPRLQSTWMDLEVGLTGSTVSAPLSGQAPDCVLFGASGQYALTAQETTTRPGDSLACDFSTGEPFWEENRGGEIFTRTQLNVGGPWAPGMYTTSESYRAAGGEAHYLRVDRILFRTTEEELRAAGMMTATTRIVNMPPGSRTVTIDRYPTLRMVSDGELRWGTIALESQPSEVPRTMFKLGRYSWVDWTKPQQVVLSNESDRPAELIEWTVAPTSNVTQ